MMLFLMEGVKVEIEYIQLDYARCDILKLLVLVFARCNILSCVSSSVVENKRQAVI